MKSKINSWIAAIIAILALSTLALISAPACIGLGVSPADMTLAYDKNLVRPVNLIILNNEHRNMEVSVEAVGELAEFMQYEKTITVSSDQEQFQYNALIALPEDTLPGKHAVKLVFTEKSRAISSSRITAQLQVASIIIVDVPYPELYVDSELVITARELAEPVVATVLMTNKGTVAVKRLSGVVSLYDGDKLLERKEFVEETGLQKEQLKSFVASFATQQLVSGLYSIRARIVADSFYTDIGRDLSIGNMTAEVLDFTTYFEKGKVNKFPIDVRNGWNRKIRNVYADVEISGIGKTKSLTYDLEPLEKKTILSYWDAKDVPLGVYDATVYLHYPNTTIVKKGKVHVIEPEVFTPEISKPVSSDTLYMLLAFVILLAVLLNILYILYRKSKKKELRHELSEEKKLLEEKLRQEELEKRRKLAAKRRKGLWIFRDKLFDMFRTKRDKPLPELDLKFKKRQNIALGGEREGARSRNFLSDIGDLYRNTFSKKKEELELPKFRKGKQILPEISLKKEEQRLKTREMPVEHIKLPMFSKTKKSEEIMLEKKGRLKDIEHSAVELPTFKRKQLKEEKADDFEQKNMLSGIVDSYKDIFGKKERKQEKAAAKKDDIELPKLEKFDFERENVLYQKEAKEQKSDRTAKSIARIKQKDFRFKEEKSIELPKSEAEFDIPEHKFRVPRAESKLREKKESKELEEEMGDFSSLYKDSEPDKQNKKKKTKSDKKKGDRQ